MQVTPEDVHQSVFESPRRRLAVEVYCLLLVFTFHEDNNNTKKMLTWALTAIILPGVIGALFDYVDPPQWFIPLVALWGAIIAKMHDFELNNFAGVEFQYTEGDDGDD